MASIHGEAETWNNMRGEMEKQWKTCQKEAQLREDQFLTDSDVKVRSHWADFAPDIANGRQSAVWEQIFGR